MQGNGGHTFSGIGQICTSIQQVMGLQDGASGLHGGGQAGGGGAQHCLGGQHTFNGAKQPFWAQAFGLQTGSQQDDGCGQQGLGEQLEVPQSRAAPLQVDWHVG